VRWFDKAPIEQQMVGLDPLWCEVKGRTVLDVGCAEGLIALECKKAGARLILGIDNRESAVKEARGVLDCDTTYTCDVVVADVIEWEPRASFDVVLMLGVLHKLPNPEQVFARFLGKCNDLAVVRLPSWPILRDERSGNVRINMDLVAAWSSFELEQVTDGPHGQRVGYLRRMM
jgi:2-polyprenyl-3-methyl-5-hydroxy-6-metoxy-1,4-benzoquinol methylase